MYSYDTVVEALNGLKERGFILDFNVAFDKLICHENGVCLNVNDFEIVEIYRFEGATNPSDEDVLYAIESKDGAVKGSFTGAFGAYADPMSEQLLKKLTIAKNNS